MNGTEKQVDGFFYEKVPFPGKNPPKRFWRISVANLAVRSFSGRFAVFFQTV